MKRLLGSLAAALLLMAGSTGLALALPAERAEVAQKLVALGVDAVDASARVEALTDDEVARLVEGIDTLPAGGGGGGGPLAIIAGGVCVAVAVLILLPIVIVTIVYQVAKHAGTSRPSAPA
ncbi:MAG TPA: PA2779 family protein [Burkholderiales bacterium]